MDQDLRVGLPAMDHASFALRTGVQASVARTECSLLLGLGR